MIVGRSTSLRLDGHSAEFIDGQVSQGRYGTASDVVRAGLCLLEDQAAKLAALGAALIEGENSGPVEPFDFDAFIARKVSTATRGP